MKKNLLFNKFNSSKKPILIFLLAVCTSFASFAQTRQITGKVTSADDGTGILGATVKVKGTATSAITGVNGSFRVSVTGNATLVFSYIGYNSKEFTLGSS